MGAIRSQRLRAAFRDELDRSMSARRAGDFEGAWHALERAHIVSQPILRIHLAAHFAMLRLALETRDAREIAGQLWRLVLAPLGALSGRIPHGNTGRSNVSAFREMPIPPDLCGLLDTRRK